MPEVKIAIRTKIDSEVLRQAKANAALAGVSLAEIVRRSLTETAAGKVPREVKRDK